MGHRTEELTHRRGSAFTEGQIGCQGTETAHYWPKKQRKKSQSEIRDHLMVKAHLTGQAPMDML